MQRETRSDAIWPILASAGAAAAVAWAIADYRAWRALGEGGLPPNLWGWLQTTRWRLMQRDPLAIQPAPGAGSVHLAHDLPLRPGKRPRVAPHPVPHRQLTQQANAATREKLVALFDAQLRAGTAHLTYARSHFEKRNQAITLRCPSCGHMDARMSHGEIAHIHPSDGSMHMILSARDANTAIETGWAERHGLAGIALGLPATYMLVYAPRDDGDLAVIDRILAAAIAHMRGTAAEPG